VTRRAVATVAAALLAAGALGACSAGGTGAAGAAGGSNYVSGDGTITYLPPSRRRDPVDLSGATLEGRQLDLATLRGKVVVLNVWGSWCPPCRKEARDLQQAYEQLGPQGVEFVGINFRDPDPAPAQAFQRAFGITYPSLRDDGGSALLALRGAVSANSIPSTLVLDEQGRVAARASTVVTRTTLVDLVEDVRSGRAAG
jgi:thiol-disulfide isomerase/thioredoxin